MKNLYKIYEKGQETNKKWEFVINLHYFVEILRKAQESI